MAGKQVDIEKIKESLKGLCVGCAHSNAFAEAPGRPSGERPCHFCFRNPDLEDPPKVKAWYDHSEPIKVPMDCYHSVDMLRQIEQWVKDAKAAR